MEHYINPISLSKAFTVPTAAVDNYLKFAKPEHVKVLLYILRHIADDPTEAEIAEACGAKPFDVTEAILFWADAGILLPKNPPAAEQKSDKREKPVSRTEKPERSDCIKRGLEDEKIKYMLHEAQIKFGRNLKTNEMRTLVWLYDDEGLDVSLILLIIQYAVSHGKANIRFIEKTACDWIEKSISNITEADEQLRRMALSEEAWSVVSKAFGLERRKPSEKESGFAYKWVSQWQFDEKMLAAAYNACVDAKTKINFAYIDKILENWHKNGYKTPDEIKNGKKDSEDKNPGCASYDLDLFEKMLDSKD